MTVNVHKGFTFLNRKFVLPELKDAVTALSADVVCLQEVIGSHPRHASRYLNWPVTPQYEYLADTMWTDYSYGRNAVYPDGDHGNALLSKFPIISYRNLDVSVRGSEERGILHSVLDFPGAANVHVACVHFGLREKHRRFQLALLKELLDSLPSSEAVVVAGDFNDWREQAHRVLYDCGMHEVFIQAHGRAARSFPAIWPVLRLDRIYVRNARTRDAAVLHRRPWSHLSDHAPLIVQVDL